MSDALTREWLDGDALTREWLEADGLGGFASGTVAGIRTRRYHALLLTATTPPTGRVVLVNGFDAWVTTSSGRYAITSQAYGPDVTYPDGASRADGFTLEPWPRWTFTLPDGTRIAQEIVVPKGASAAAVAWKLLSGTGVVTLELRPFLAGRDYHSLHHENPDFRFDPETTAGGRVRFRPYANQPAISMRSNGAYAHAPEWYRNFLYAEERARGLDFSEDLASPGALTFDLSRDEAIWLMAAEGHEAALGTGSAESALETLRTSERTRRAAFPDRLERSADAYLVRRGEGRTVVAGYPWFTDWGRDTFIALRGLCLATGRLDEAGQILVQWAGAVSEGMLPNLFPDGKVQPEFNSVDASLWYLVAVHEYFQARAASGRRVAGAERTALQNAFGAILSGYARGTRYGIRADADGLLAAGRARRPADLDGREGRRLGRHAAYRQARRDPGALDQRPEDRRRLFRRLPRPARAGDRVLRKAFLERGGGLPPRRRRRRPSSRHRRLDPPAQPDLRRRRPPVPPGDGRARAADRRRGRVPPRNAARTAHPAARTPGLPPALRRGAARARRRLPPGDRLAVPPGRFRRSLGPRARAAAPKSSARRASASWRRSSPTSTRPASATSPRSPTPTRPTPREAAPSRPGRSASSCGSIAWSSPSRPSPTPPSSPSGLDTPAGARHPRSGHDRQEGRPRPRAPAPRRGRQAREELEALGALPLRAAVGHGARGLQPGRHGLGLLPARARPLAGLSLGRGRPRRDLRPPPVRLLRDRALEREGPDPEGAPLRPDGPAGQPRRGRQGVLLLPRLDADALLHEGALQVPAARVPVPAARRREPAPRRGSDPEFELVDTGIFDDDRYFDVFAEYAKASPDDILVRIARRQPRSRGGDGSTCCRRSGSATPGPGASAPAGSGCAPASVTPGTRRSTSTASTTAACALQCEGSPELLFTENEIERPRGSGAPRTTRRTSRTGSMTTSSTA